MRYNRPHDPRMAWDHEAPGDGWGSLLWRLGLVVGLLAAVIAHARYG